MVDTLCRMFRYCILLSGILFFARAAQAVTHQFTYATVVNATALSGAPREQVVINYFFDDAASSTSCGSACSYPSTAATLKVGGSTVSMSQCQIFVGQCPVGPNNTYVLECGQTATDTGTLFSQSVTRFRFFIDNNALCVNPTVKLSGDTSFASSSSQGILEINLTGATLLQFYAPAAFSLVERRFVVSDFRSPGDRLLFTDPLTQLQWLSPQVTRGVSYNSIIGGYQGLIITDRFSVASAAQVQQLLATHFANPTTANEPRNVPRALTFFDTLGVTENTNCSGTTPPGACPRTQAWSLMPTGNLRGLGMVTEGDNSNGSVIDFSGTVNDFGGIEDTQRGTWLVRSTLTPAVPALTPVSLAALGLLLAMLGVRLHR